MLKHGLDTFGQPLEVSRRQVADRTLECANCATGCRMQELFASRCGIHANGPLVILTAPALDPTTRYETLEYAAHCRSPHPERRGQLRCCEARVVADANQSSVQSDGRAGHPLELPIEGAHAINQRTRCNQGRVFQRLPRLVLDCLRSAHRKVTIASGDT